MGLLDNLEDPYISCKKTMTGVDYTILDLHILESWILTNGKLKTVVYDNRKLFQICDNQTFNCTQSQSLIE